MIYGKSNDHVTDDVTKSQVVKTAGDAI